MIRFNRPDAAGRELEYLAAAIKNGRFAGGGHFTQRCQELLEQELGVAKAFLTTSCTTALEMAALLLNIREGDEVVVPSFSFVSTANAFAMRGARPIFADIRSDTLNLDESRLERKITSRTKAIVAMHYAGIGCELDVIVDLARRYSIAVVEDNAHGLLGKYRGRYLGTFGRIATQSFHETKNFTCGEGGALLLNDADLIPRAEIIWEKGTDRGRFLRGQVDKYTWVDLGSSYLPADLLAALLLAQLEARAEIQSRRKRIWEFYREHLDTWAQNRGVRLPIVPEHVTQPYHLFYLILQTPAERDRLIQYLARHNIESAFHYVPLHLSKMGQSFGGRIGDCPVSENLSERLLRLPFHNRLTEEEQMQIVSVLAKSS